MKDVELLPEERAVIAAARDAIDPTEMQRARVRRGLDAKLAAGVAAPLLVSSTALAAVLKVGAGVAVAAAIGGGVFAVVPRLQRTVAPPAVSTPRPRPAPIAIPAPPPPVAPPTAPVAALPEPRPTPAHARPAVHRPAAPPPADLAGELGLLTQANAATQAGDAARAGELLRAYDRAYPSGQLTQERAAAGILVHCAAGHVQTARAEARRFLERWPRSPLIARIEASCARADVAP